MYPEDYVSELHSLQGRYLHDVGRSAKPGMVTSTPVVTYRSTLTGKRNDIRGSMRKFMAARAEDPESCVGEIGEKEWRIYGTDPVYSISDKTFLLVLTGKGTVKEIQDVLKVVSLMLERKNPSKALYDCTTLRQFVDDNVGHDCNGLVFSYFRSVHGLAKTEDKKCWKYRDWERERKSHLDVRELDLVFPSDGGHILIIGRIWNRTPDSFDCYISESRSWDLGGPQAHRYRVKRKSNGKWELRFLDKSEHAREMGLICSSFALYG